MRSPLCVADFDSAGIFPGDDLAAGALDSIRGTLGKSVVLGFDAVVAPPCITLVAGSDDPARPALLAPETSLSKAAQRVHNNIRTSTNALIRNSRLKSVTTNPILLPV